MCKNYVYVPDFSDAGLYWRSWYDTDTFEEDLRELFNQLKPLYEQLHAYVRTKLKEKYGASRFPSTGHIPAHLFGKLSDICLKERIKYSLC